MNRNKFGISWKFLLMIVLVFVCLVAVPLSAKYIKQTGDLVNTFSRAEESLPEISEDFNHETKENVSVKVPDNGYPVYVRVAIIITWKDKDGVVYYKAPVLNRDYEITLLEGEDEAWEYDVKDGYYYYKYPVPSDGQTSVLIEKCVQAAEAEVPEGCVLSVEVIAQTIQAVGSTDVSGQPMEPGIPAYKDAWKTSWVPQEEPADEPGTEEGEP